MEVISFSAAALNERNNGSGGPIPYEHDQGRMLYFLIGPHQPRHNGTSKNFQFWSRPFLPLLVRWAKRPERRVRGSDWLTA